MPGLTEKPQETPFKTITIKELHPTFVAEVQGVDFSHVSDEQFSEIKAAMAKYGVCIFRKTELTDKTHVEFSERFGELDNTKRYMQNGRKSRFDYYEIFDAGNVDGEGNVLGIDNSKIQYGLGNKLWHVDSSFNPRRASYSLLRAAKLPPPGTGGNTEFADSRSAFDSLPLELKTELFANNYVAAHCMAQSRKRGSPEYFAHLKPEKETMSLHRILQRHEPSGRMNIYTAAHAHHIEGVSEEKSAEILNVLADHISQKRFVCSVVWENEGDLVIWDNTCVQHRADGGSFEGKFARDLRRTTVHDTGPTAWGENEVVPFYQ